MAKSKIDITKQFNEEVWVVSVLNTGDKLGGHAMIVVEGMQKNSGFHSQLFVGQYDILAVPTENQDAVINKKGCITDVRCFEADQCQRSYEEYASKSYFIDPNEAKKMIISIKKDKEICDKAKRGEGEYPLYQYVGTIHPLSDTGMGHNCASWCVEKLKEGGINLDVSFAKPKSLVSDCSVM